MVNASKILTVSYGTFSCTLEGFDDPFSTMRSIAEYFRDLAADDRYFGAEPPTPDAEMLHKIAEREINRRVEAKIQHNGVVLRQVEDDAPLLAAAPSPAVAKPAQRKPAAPKPAQAAAVAEPVVETGALESVAAKLARIRAAVARSRNEPQLGSIFAEDERPEEAFEAEAHDFAEAAPEPEPEAATEMFAEDADKDDAGIEATDDISAPEVDEESETSVSVAQDDHAEDVSDETEEAAEAAADAQDGIAKAVSEAKDAEEVVEAAEFETQYEQPEAAASRDDLAWDLSDETADAAPTVRKDDAPAEDVEDFDMAAIMAASEETDAAPFEDVDEADAESPKDDGRVTGLDALLTEARAAEENAEDEPVDEPIGEDMDLSSFMDSVQTDADVDATSTEAEVEPPAATEEAEDAPRAPKVRVVKMSRTAFEAQFVEDGIEDAELASEPEDAPQAQDDASETIRESLGDTGLSPEDEDDLIKELAEVERDAELEKQLDASTDDADFGDALVLEPHQMKGAPTGAETTGPDAIAAALKEVAAEASDKIAKQSGDGTDQKRPGDEVSVDRLLAQTNSELQNTEGSRRRSAIAHLKAAVAAVRADGGRAAKNAKKDEAKALGQYRDDLARAVRPEDAPEKEATTTEIKDESPESPPAQTHVSAPAHVTSNTPRTKRRMPPLMLVSEQRIDKPAPTDAGAAPVRPRRVHSDDLDEELEDGLFQDDVAEGTGDAAGNLFSDDADFKSFVADSGAEGLQELLEASAAYGTLVAGKPDSTRPEIMRRVIKMTPEGTFSREDGLRAFGVLLREGRIQRVDRGRFTIASSSRFNPQKKSAAN